MGKWNPSGWRRLSYDFVCVTVLNSRYKTNHHTYRRGWPSRAIYEELNKTNHFRTQVWPE